jgi:phage FluMu gp28-like protein
MTNFWLHFPVLLVPKSRQMSATWLYCALYLWEAFFYSHRLTFFQSKKESDANELLLRAGQMYAGLPVWMREWNQVEQIYAYMEFSRSKSRIFGIPSGPDAVRGYQPTGIFSDEIVFQPSIDLLIAAVRPAIRGGGKLTLVSSAGPGVFARLVLDA